MRLRTITLLGTVLAASQAGCLGDDAAREGGRIIDDVPSSPTPRPLRLRPAPPPPLSPSGERLVDVANERGFSYDIVCFGLDLFRAGQLPSDSDEFLLALIRNFGQGAASFRAKAFEVHNLLVGLQQGEAPEVADIACLG